MNTLVNFNLRAGTPWIGRWLPVLLGLAALYLPTYWRLANGIWNNEEDAHGPLILMVAYYLLWTKRDAFTALGGDKPWSSGANVVAGWLLLVFGLLMYAIGRSQTILILEVGSQLPVFFGALLLTLGMRGALALWFPVLFLVFMVPLPSSLVDALTGTLKQQVSVIAEQVLYLLNYPIARSGVTLTIGPYQLLVADACSGLHSMFSLSALGLLYVHLMQHGKALRNGILLASILPIAFAANVARVLILVLVTYYFGDEAGQGFVHDAAGILLFVVALIMLFMLDKVLGFFLADNLVLGGAK